MKSERLFYLSLLIISILTVFDLFINTGEPATMDGVIHISGMAQFASALLQGQFPVIWLNNFANYGLPVGIFSHQIPLYIGALFVIITKNPVLSANILTLQGVVLANLLFYRFLRIYFPPVSAFLGTLLLVISPFRILDTYIRGAIPELFSLFLLPLILILIQRLFIRKKLSSFFWLATGFALLILTHPMMMVIYSVFIFPYFIFLLYQLYQECDQRQLVVKKMVTRVLLFLSTIVMGLGIASYYIFPLFLEKKYFYFGASTNLLTNDFMGFTNFFSSRWYYYYKDNIFTRGHVLQFGLPETILLIAGIISCLAWWHSKKDRYEALLITVLVVGGIGVFLTLRTSAIIYSIVPLLSNIQFPWRMFTVVMFVPPVILAILVERYKQFAWAFMLMLLVVFALRSSQMYGKNYTIHPESYYQANLQNLYSVNMNTIWTGKTEDYPPRTAQTAVINGIVKIVSEKVTGVKRIYEINASTPSRLVDYTFYFPGWNVYVDGVKTPVQFQDPNYRGVITYDVPAGQHKVEVVFQDTTIRRIAKLLTTATILFVASLYLLRKKTVEKLVAYV